mmetsp:Transcript_36624/g.87407  ORF Transcript_36624/g.87407 Transcript_36624/m.87407 type:complete len:371 (+) Transcript_36624:69-1181(+)
MSIHLPDLTREVIPELRPFQFERWRHESALRREYVRVEVDRLRSLEAVQATGLRKPLHLPQDLLPQLVPPAQLGQRRVCGVGDVRRGPRPRRLLVGNHDRDEVCLERVAVHERLPNEERLVYHVLDLLGGHVLSLGQLKDILLPIDDLKLSLGRPKPDVARVKPSLVIDRLSGLLLVLVVPLEHGRPSDTNLASTPAGLAVVGGVCAQVSHLGHVDEDHLDALVRSPDVSDARDVVRVPDRRRRAALRLAVSLHDRHAEQAAEENHDVRAERRRARHHAPDAVESQRPLDLVEEEPVPNRVCQPSLVEAPRLDSEGCPEHLLRESALRRHARLDLVVNLVEHPRDHRDDSRAARDDVLDEEERVAPVERH